MAITSAITLYKGNQSSALSKPLVSGETVTEKSVDAGRSMRRSALLLMRKRIQRDKLEAKYFRLIDKQKSKQKARNEENKQEQTSFLSGVGSGIKQSASKLGGNLFGAIGDLLGFLALNWIANPKNHSILTTIVSGLKSVLKFAEWFVTGSVNNFFTGFYKMVKEDASIMERFIGFFQMATGAVGIFYALNPFLAVKHAYKLVVSGPKKIKFLKFVFKKFQKQGLGKTLKFLFPKTSKVVTNIATKFNKVFKIPQAKELLGKILSKISVSGTNFLKNNTIIQAISKKLLLFAKSGGGKALKGALRTLTKPFVKFVDKVPLVGPFLGMVINRAFGDPWGMAAFKALGTGLGQWMGAAVGTLIFPGVGTFLGGFLGALIGDWLGGRIYKFFLNGKKGEIDPLSAKEKAKAEALKRATKEANKKGLEGEERDEYLNRALRNFELSASKDTETMLRAFKGSIDATTTEIEVVGPDAKGYETGHYIQIGQEVMKVLSNTPKMINVPGQGNQGEKEYVWSNLSVVRGWGGTKATSHLQAATIKTLGFNNPIIKNGLVVERTNDLKNGSENQILENKIGNGNGESVVAINGGNVIQNNTNINSQITSETSNLENSTVQDN